MRWHIARYPLWARAEYPWYAIQFRDGTVIGMWTFRTHADAIKHTNGGNHGH